MKLRSKRSQVFWTAPTPYLNLVPQLLAFYYYYLVIYVLTPFLMGMRVFFLTPAQWHGKVTQVQRWSWDVSWGKNKFAFKHWTPTWTLILSNWASLKHPNYYQSIETHVAMVHSSRHKEKYGVLGVLSRARGRLKAYLRLKESVNIVEWSEHPARTSLLIPNCRVRQPRYKVPVG